MARDQTDSTNLCSDYVEHFLRDNPAPGIGWEAGVLAPLLETVDTEDVNQIAERYDTWDEHVSWWCFCFCFAVRFYDERISIARTRDVVHSRHVSMGEDAAGVACGHIGEKLNASLSQ